MKKGINKFLVLCVGVFMLIGMPMIADTYQSYYTQYATVLKVTENETFFVDATMNVWNVYDTDYHENDTVKIKFYTNHTDYTREDDKIISIKRVD